MAKKFKKEQSGMSKPIEIIDKVMQESLDFGLSQQDYLDYLKELLFEVENQINIVTEELS